MSQLPPPPPPPGGPVGPGGPPMPPPPGGGWQPPPPSGGGGGIDVGAALGYGWNKFTQNAGALLAIIAVVVVVQLLGGFVVRSFDSFVMIMAGQLALWVIGQILTIGMYNAALMITRGEQPSVSNVFQTDRLGDFIVASLLTGIAVFVGLLLCIIPGLIAAVMLSFAPYFVLDARRSGTDALSDSFNLVKANAGTVIVVLIVAFVLQFVGILACGIGLLVTGPVASIMVAYTYKKLTGQPVAP